MGALELRATAVSLSGDAFRVMIEGLGGDAPTFTYVGTDGHPLHVASEDVSTVETPVGEWITATVAGDQSTVTLLSVLMPVVGSLAGVNKPIPVSTVAVETLRSTWFSPGFPRDQATSYTTSTVIGNAYVERIPREVGAHRPVRSDALEWGAY